MNKNPAARNAAHGAALERYRVAQVTLYRYANHENTINGRGTAYLETQPEYLALVAARDTARAEVERVNPAAKPPKLTASLAAAQAARSEALMWVGGAVVALSLVTYSLQSIYRGLDSLFTAQKAAPLGGVGLIFVALAGLALLFVGLGWSSLINRRNKLDG